jgi:hypothetical protein
MGDKTVDRNMICHQDAENRSNIDSIGVYDLVLCSPRVCFCDDPSRSGHDGYDPADIPSVNLGVGVLVDFATSKTRGLISACAP